MKIAPHLHRIGNDLVAAYLVDLPGGITLIDAGLPGHWGELLQELKSIGRELTDIRGLILTHGDSDHIGFAEHLRRETGISVYVHAADSNRVRTGEKPKTPLGSARLLPTLKFLAYSVRKGGMHTRYVEQVAEVAAGEALDLPGNPVIVGMPGHSPGSIAIHISEVSAVFVGDALTTRHVLTGREGAQAAPFTDDPQLACESLTQLAGLDASWVLPGHGAPWEGSPGDLVAAVRSH